MHTQHTQHTHTVHTHAQTTHMHTHMYTHYIYTHTLHMHTHTCAHTTHTLATYTHVHARMCDIAWFVHMYMHIYYTTNTLQMHSFSYTCVFSQYINELTINVAMCEDKGPRSKQELALRWAIFYLKHWNLNVAYGKPVYTSASSTFPSLKYILVFTCFVFIILDSLFFFLWVVFGGS